MQVRTTGIIKSMDLPTGFVLAHQEAGTRGANWLRKYGPAGDKSVEICDVYRGYPQVPIDNERLRELLAKAPLVVFDKATDVCDTDSIKQMSLALGNVGDNQLTNRLSGLSGPMFELEKLVADFVGGRSVIRVEGWFHDAGFKPDKFFSGIFFDATPEDENARVEELFLQCESLNQQLQYRPAFDQLLASIKWK